MEPYKLVFKNVHDVNLQIIQNRNFENLFGHNELIQIIFKWVN